MATQVVDEKQWLRKHQLHGKITRGASDIILLGLGDLSVLNCSCGEKRLTRGGYTSDSSYTLIIFDEAAEMPDDLFNTTERWDLSSASEAGMDELRGVDQQRDPYRRHYSHRRGYVVPRLQGQTKGRLETRRGQRRRRQILK